MMKGWRFFLCGLCIGAADLVPGISGGTVALMLGLYEQIIAALHSLTSICPRLLWQRRWKEAAQATPWRFLPPLLLGMLVALAGLAQGVYFLLSQPHYCELLYASFCGLVLASAWMMVERVRQWTGWRIALACIAAVFAFSFTSGASTALGSYEVALPKEAVAVVGVPLINYDYASERLTGLTTSRLAILRAKNIVDDDTIVYSGEASYTLGNLIATWEQDRPLFNPWVFLCGLLAICATLSPGLSGSYCLNALGIYGTVIAALADTSRALMQGSLAYEPLRFLLTLAMGIAVGAVTFARLLSWALRRHHDSMLTVMIGFMLGSLRSIWPFRASAYVLDPAHWERGPQLFLGDALWPDVMDATCWVAVLCCGIALVAARMLEGYAKRRRIEVQSSTATVFSSTSRVQ